MTDNPKTATTDNTEKDPADWVTGDEPITVAQPSSCMILTRSPTT